MPDQIYRDCMIRHDPPPIPDRRHDWCWTHRDYGGPGDQRCGTAPTPEACKAAIDEMYLEQAEATGLFNLYNG